MSSIVSISKRGTITLPPALRKRLALNNIEHPLFMVTEENGRIVLEPATAVPLRDLSKEAIKAWIEEDETAMESFENLA